MTDVHTIEIHTGDRGTFKRCRRKWHWGSPIRANLVPSGGEEKGPLWFGSGFHFAMEDYHGRQRFPTPEDAFAAYVDATDLEALPSDSDDFLDLGFGMIEYYTGDWLFRHAETWDTLWVDGVPQVEVEVAIDITHLLPPHVVDVLWKSCRECRLQSMAQAEHVVMYICTFDRVIKDSKGRLWGVDYKTAAQFDMRLQMNAQAEAYDWAMSVYYADEHVEGILWQQHLKAVPNPPKLINKGRAYSKDQRQYTSYAVYHRTLMEAYGSIPDEYQEMLQHLMEGESAEGDRFIRRDPIHRTDIQRRAAQAKIVLEVTEMLDPGLPMYPNATRDCAWDCPFQAPCMMMDDGSDYTQYLADEFVQWEGYRDDWRERIVYPSEGITK